MSSRGRRKRLGWFLGLLAWLVLPTPGRAIDLRLDRLDLLAGLRAVWHEGLSGLAAIWGQTSSGIDPDGVPASQPPSHVQSPTEASSPSAAGGSTS